MKRFMLPLFAGAAICVSAAAFTGPANAGSRPATSPVAQMTPIPPGPPSPTPTGSGTPAPYPSLPPGGPSPSPHP